MKNYAAAIFVLASVVSAEAADIARGAPAQPVIVRAPVAVVYNWSGIYIGANGGYAWGRSSGSLSVTGNPFLFGTAFGETELNGGVAGGQIGVNWQTGHFVLGVEIDAQWSGQENSITAGCGVGCTVTESLKSQWFGTARARLGVAMDRALFYATGGVAFANIEYDLSGTAGGVTVNVINLSDNKVGWTVGAGLEFAFADNVSAKFEYLFVAVDGLSQTAAIPALFGGGTFTGSTDLRNHIARVGLNFRFPVGGPVVARY